MDHTKEKNVAETSFRFDVGEFECRVITDGTIIVPDSMPKGHSSPPDMSRGQKMDVLCLFVNTGKRKILVDTGCGNGYQSTTGKLVENLTTAGISCAEIETIIHTHGHMDHVAGSFDDKGRPVFPKARYIVSQKEWECWVTRPERPQLQHMFSAARKYYLPIPEQFDLVEDQAEPIPGFKLMPAPGHTPGGIALEITSGVKKLLCIGDMIHAPLEFTDPRHYSFLDVAPDQAIHTRTRILSGAAKSGLPVFASHFGFPGLGHMVQKGGILSWRPTQLKA
jgi:glyoxylase-like metal-dependent hydrolase (beta-lactamase superfamily II)